MFTIYAAIYVKLKFEDFLISWDWSLGWGQYKASSLKWNVKSVFMQRRGCFFVHIFSTKI